MYHKKCQQQKDQLDQSEGKKFVQLIEFIRNAKNNLILDEEEKIIEKRSTEFPKALKKETYPYGTVINRNTTHDYFSAVETVSFTSLGKMQPFLISLTSSSMLLMDFHCHLTTDEVVGYLGGFWDINSQTLSVTHVFPCLNSPLDRNKAGNVEYEIQKKMIQSDCTLVGWYHSHPQFNPQPTLRDIDNQLNYEMIMRGTSEATYSPCFGLIYGTYHEDDDFDNESKMLPFIVIPPHENRQHELSRPVMMNMDIKQDQTLPNGIKDQMIETFSYYKTLDYELVNFAEMKMNEDQMVIDKMKNSLYPKFPLEDQLNNNLWNWIRELIGLEREEKIAIPKKCLEKQRQREDEEIAKANKIKQELEEKEEKAKEMARKLKEEEEEEEATKQATLNAISTLQQQLSQPSGLNMTPSPISSAILLPGTVTTNSNNNNHQNNSPAAASSSSPRDSPATIPSNAPSPAKFEIPVRASPSPAKSDASSNRTRNSPAPSPGKGHMLDRPTRNSSSISSNSSKYDYSSLAGMNPSHLSELYAATLASFASKLPPGLLPNDYTAMLQNSKMPDFGMSALNSLTASAAALSGTGGSNNYHSSPSGGNNKKNSSSYSNSQHHQQQQQHHHQQQQQQQQHLQQPSTSGGSQNNNANNWLSQIPNMKEFMSQLEKSGDLNVLMQSPYNIPSCKPSQRQEKQQSSTSARTEYHMPENTGTTSSGKRKGRPPNNPAPPPVSHNNYNNDYDDYKTEAGKIADLMKSPEYTQMLMNQANAFRGLGTEITVTRKSGSNKKSSSSSSSQSSSNQNSGSNAQSSGGGGGSGGNSGGNSGGGGGNSGAGNSLLNQLPVMDLNYLAEISKSIPELNALLNSNKPEDINALLQMQMMAKSSMDYASQLFGTGGGPISGSSSGNSNKNNSNTANAKAMQDYAAAAASSNMLSQYMSGMSGMGGGQNLSSLFGPMYGMGSMESPPPEHQKQSSGNSRKRDNSSRNSGNYQTALAAATAIPSLSTTNVAPNAADLLNSLFTNSSKGNSFLGSHDLSAYFGGMPAGSNNPHSHLTQSSSKSTNNSSSGGGITSGLDYSALFSQMSPAKLQEMTSLFSQAKYPGIPDPLAKSTLAANNMYYGASLSPSLMKLQQEALNTRLMKPPKSSSSSSSSKIDTPPPQPISASPHRSTPTKSSSSRDSPAMPGKYNFSVADLSVSSHPLAATDFSRKLTPTPPSSTSQTPPIKKRMEFSSIAELVAPSPSKRQKYDDDDDVAVLNLSNN